MGTLLIVIGGIWALIGGGNLVGMPWTSGASGILTMGLMFNMLVFVFPGLILVGLGSRMRSKKRVNADKHPEPITRTDLSDERECPHCAELIKAKAVKCKHCGSDVGAHRTNDKSCEVALDGDTSKPEYVCSRCYNKKDNPNWCKHCKTDTENFNSISKKGE